MTQQLAFALGSISFLAGALTILGYQALKLKLRQWSFEAKLRKQSRGQGSGSAVRCPVQDVGP